MIVVLSLNTAVDRMLHIPGFTPGTVMRAREAQAFAGGKGLNVARNLRRLGLPVRVIGFLGGSPRSFIEDSCTQMGIETRWVLIQGESRTCVTVVDPESDRQTVLNEPGPDVQPEEIERLLEELRRSVQSGDILCISGSAPPAVPDAVYGQIVTNMRRQGARVLVDASGGAMRSALHASPWAIAPNEEESRTVVPDGGSIADIARALSSQAEIVLLTLGKDGCILASGDETWRVHSPPIREVNAVGSGDAFAAGFLAGIERSGSPQEAVRLAVACGASNAARFDLGIGPFEEIDALKQQVILGRL